MRRAAIVCITFPLTFAALVGSSCSSIEKTEEHVAAADGALLRGAENVSRFTGDTYHESGASSVVAGDGASTEYVAYSSPKSNHITLSTGTFNGQPEETRDVCRGATTAGYSIRDSTTGAWSQFWVDPPSGYSLLWGTPAMTKLHGSVYLASLASSDGRFGIVSDTQGCIHFTSTNPASKHTMSDLAFPPLTSACVARGTAPGTLGNVQCLDTGNHVLEGGHMSATVDRVYLAYRDATDQKAVVYRATETGSFSLLPPTPSIGSVVAPPMLAGAGADVYMLVPVQSGTSTILKVLLFLNSTSQWSSTVATLPGTVDATTILGDFSHGGSVNIASAGYDFKVLPVPQAPPNLVVALQSGGGVQAYLCPTFGTTLPSCSQTPFYRSEFNVVAWGPAIAGPLDQVLDPPPAPPGFTSSTRIISHWAEAKGLPGIARMRFHVGPDDGGCRSNDDCPDGFYCTSDAFTGVASCQFGEPTCAF